MDAYVEERLSDYLDGTLSDQERQIVEAQLAASERARVSYESLRYTVNLLKQTPAPVLPRQFTLPVTSLAPANNTRMARLGFAWGCRCRNRGVCNPVDNNIAASAESTQTANACLRQCPRCSRQP